MIKIPLNPVPSQSIKVVLAGQNCEIKIYYRFGTMYMDLICNNSLVQSGAVCRNRASIVQVANNNFKGSLHFVDLLGESEPIYKDFQSRYSLLYVSEDEELPRGLFE